jgi:serine/threonine-protein kinase
VEAPPAAERNEAIRTIAIGPPAETSASIEPMPQAASTGSVPLQTRGDPEDTAAADRRAESLPAPDASFASWATHRNARFGFALRYPGEVFAAAETTSGDIPVRTFMSRDGRATLLITAGPIADGLTLPKYRRSVMEQRYGGATYDYTPQQAHWFVLSGTRGEEMFYERITFACDGRSLHGWQLRYPLADRAFYDRIVEAMHRGYRHSNGPGARCAGKGEATALSKSPAASAAAKVPAAAQF